MTMKVKIKGGRALISAGANTPFKDYLRQAEEDFLKDVEKGIKKVVGNKVKTSIKGGSVVWLEGSGVNSSDHEVTFMMHVIPKAEFDVKLFIKFEDVMRGKSSDEVPFKTGTLTPASAVDVFKRYWS